MTGHLCSVPLCPFSAHSFLCGHHVPYLFNRMASDDHLGKKIPFWSACNVTVVAYIPVILATVFSFICSFTVVTGFIAAFVSSVASIATMILLYCGITRLADHKKSALWPYVIAQAALKLVTIIIAVIFIFVCLMILSAMLAAFVSRW